MFVLHVQLLDRDPRPGRRARSTQAVPRAPRPRVRARASCPPRSRGRLGHGPAPPGPRRAVPAAAARSPTQARSRGRAGSAARPGLARRGCAAVGPRPARGCARRAGAGGGGGVGARLCGLLPGGKLGPGAPRPPPARSPAPSGRRCDPGCGPGPGCELRAVPALLQQGSCTAAAMLLQTASWEACPSQAFQEERSEARRRRPEPRQLHLQPVGENSEARAAAAPDTP